MPPEQDAEYLHLLHQKAPSNNEHAATVTSIPLRDKKKNHQGGDIFTSINVITGKESVIPNTTIRC